jgi:hypothetical protein
MELVTSKMHGTIISAASKHTKDRPNDRDPVVLSIPYTAGCLASHGNNIWGIMPDIDWLAIHIFLFVLPYNHPKTTTIGAAARPCKTILRACRGLCLRHSSGRS